MEKNEWEFESQLGQNRSWFIYYAQYKRVVTDLTDSVQNRQIPIDTISLPLLFSIRHCIELGLKANILEFEKANKEIEKIKLREKYSHSLEVLYNKFTEHLRVYQAKYPLSHEIEKQLTSYLDKLMPLKNKLHNLDKGSFNFRYPVNGEGEYNFVWNKKENLKEIISAFNEIHPLLVCTVDVLLPR